jgi:hypothetical protein
MGQLHPEFQFTDGQEGFINACDSLLGAAAACLRNSSSDVRKHNFFLALSHLVSLRTQDLLGYGVTFRFQVLIVQMFLVEAQGQEQFS